MTKSQATTQRRTRGRPRVGEAEVIESELLAGALRHFLEHGYGGTSIAQIVKSLGISKTTLYSRYPSKADLFQAILSQQIASLAANAVLHADGELLSLQDGLIAYGEKTLKISLEGDLLQVNRLIYSESHRFHELRVAATERTEQGIRQIADFIAQCAVRDAIPCRDPSGVASTYIFMLRGWSVSMMLSNEPVTPFALKRFVALAVRTLVSGREGW